MPQTPPTSTSPRETTQKRGWKKVKVFGADEEKEEPMVHRRSSVCVALDATKDLAAQLDTMDPSSTVLIHGHELGVQQAKDMLKVCRWRRRFFTLPRLTVHRSEHRNAETLR